MPRQPHLTAETQFIETANREIDGWFSVLEGLTFYEIAKSCHGDGVAVEIGSWQGKSTVCIGRGAIAGGNNLRIYAIDPHIGSEEHHKDGEVWTFEAFERNLSTFGVSEVVIPIVKFSHDAVGDVAEPIEFLFIDGAHDYDSVRTDFMDWFPKVITGGTIAFHDSHWTGVRGVLGEMVYPHPNVRNVRRVLGTTLIEKCENAGFLDRVQKKLAWWAFDWPIRFKAFRRKLLGKTPEEFT